MIRGGDDCSAVLCVSTGTDIMGVSRCADGTYYFGIGMRLGDMDRDDGC